MKYLWIGLQVLLVLASITGMVGGVMFLAWQKGMIELSVMDDFLNEERNRKCVWSIKNPSEGEAEAEIYTWGKRVYAHYIGINKEGKKSESFMLVNEDMIYAWTDAEMPGIVMPAVGKQAQFMEPSDSDGLVCQGWKVDKNKFVPPKEVKFVDYKNMQDPQCGPCEYLMGNQRDNCREMAGCSK